MARGDIRIPMALDTSGIEKEVQNGLVEPIEDAENALKALSKVDAGRDLERDLDKAQDATEDLKDELDDARDGLKKLGFAAKDAGDDAKRGMNGAGDGVEEFGDEAKSTAKEAAASFDGSAESILDAFQEVAANAFAGFGPAGVLAGLAIAAGIGIAVGEFQKAEEAAEELRVKAVELATDAQDAGVSTEAWATSAEQIVERIRELEELKSTDWRWWWQDDPSQLEDWSDALETMGREAGEVSKVLESDSVDAINAYADSIRDAQSALEDEIKVIRNSADVTDEAAMKRLDALVEEYDAHGDVLGYLDDEIKLREEAAESSQRMSDAGVDAALALAEAEEQRAEAMEGVQASVTDAYDSMRDAALEYATGEDGALDINRWLEYNQEHAAAVATYQANLEAIKLSPQQWTNLLQMPEEQRIQWVSQFAALPESARAPFAAALNDVGSSGGDKASVAFDQAFEPDADVEVQVDTAAAKGDLNALANKKRTAEIKAKATGESAAKRDLDAIAKKRTATIEAKLNTSRVTRDMNRWRRNQEARPLTITANLRIGKLQFS